MIADNHDTLTFSLYMDDNSLALTCFGKLAGKFPEAPHLLHGLHAAHHRASFVPWLSGSSVGFCLCVYMNIGSTCYEYTVYTCEHIKACVCMYACIYIYIYIYRFI